MNPGVTIEKSGGRPMVRVAGVLVVLAVAGALGAALAGWPADFRQAAEDSRTVRIHLTDGRGTPMPGVALHLDGAPLPTTVTDRQGMATLVFTRRNSTLTVHAAATRIHGLRMFVDEPALLRADAGRPATALH